MRELFSVGQRELGAGSVIFEWSPRGAWLAAAGSKRLVSVFSHTGQLVGEIHLAPPEVAPTNPLACSCLQLQWDASGSVLAVLPAGCSFIYTWSAATKELQKLETDFRTQEVTMLAWSRSSSVLAAGTAKGNLQLYHLQERRRTPVAGKHTKRVCAGAWIPGSNLLAMAALDKTMTVSDVAGDTLRTVAFKGEPLQLCAAQLGEDERRPHSGGAGGGDMQATTFSLTTSKRVVYVVKDGADASAPPLELTFMDAYGPITQHLWFGDGYLLVGFKSGQVVVVSSHRKEVSQELHSHRPLDLLQDMSYCPAVSRVAIGGGSTVKLLDTGAEYGEVQGAALELPPGHSVERVGWGEDGQVLSVSTSAGLLVTYLASLPSVFAAAGTKHAWLSSLSEVTVTDAVSRSSVVVRVDCDPAFISLGPAHLAVGINHQVLFYSHGGNSPPRLVNRRSYLGGVTAVCLNATHAAVLTGGRVLMHAIAADSASDGGGSGSESAQMQDACLPKPGAARSEPVTCMALSHHFLVTATASGTLSYYVLQDGELAAVSETKHAGGAIARLFPQPYGTRLVLADEVATPGLLNPVTDELTPLPGFDGSLQQALWDEDDPAVFVAANGRGVLHTFLFTQQSLSGQRLELLATTTLPSGHTPVLLSGGRLSVRLKSGVLDSWLLDTHRPLLDQDSQGTKQQQKRLAAAIKLNRMQDALAAARGLGTPDAWRQLAAAAVQQLDVRLATAAYRQAGDAAMVMSLAALEGVEDRNLLAGSLLVLLGQDYNHAQELLLRSSRPLAALEMRQDLKHWPQALALARQLAPERVPALSREHGVILELVGEHEQARGHYQQALDVLEQSGSDSHSSPEQQKLQQACVAGLARTLLHLGDLQGGRALAQQLDSSALWKECAAILEQRHQMQEAAELYERAGLTEKAADIYIGARNWAAVAPLMARVSSAKLQLTYARAKEAEGSWAEAAAAYEAAGDLDAAVRLNLSKLGNLGQAAALARKSRSAAAAAHVAKAALAAGDVLLAIEALLLAGQLDQAFDIAAAKGQLQVFARLAADGAKSPEDALRLAQYLEGRGQPEAAADMWAQAGQPHTAISLLVQVCTAASLTKAVELLDSSSSCAADSAPAVLAALGSCGGLEPRLRDALRLRANMAAGQLNAAAKDALELARHEQEEGNYKLAHAKLFSTLQQLHALGAAVPLEFRHALALLHSYVLVKSLLACGDHAGAARMLVRVAGNISRFPKHVVPILTSTVIECQRAGLRRTALEHACTLMRPEYRQQVSDKYSRKIELLVRKPDRGNEPPEGLTPCPYCSLPGPECQLQCVSCQSIIPFDVATGKRMSLADWCECPSCRMPCSSQPFLAILAAEGRCPMCCTGVDPADVRPLADPLSTAQAAK